MKRNIQPIEKYRKVADVLDVVKIWHTIQGEGPFMGSPAVFVRLAGCNLQCPLCDTNYTEGRAIVHHDYVIKSIVAQGKEMTELVVLTGGEPFRQNFGELARKLIRDGWTVQVETNGTMYQNLPEEVWERLVVVCSPKTAFLHPKLVPYIAAYKYVVKAGQVDSMGFPTSALDGSTVPAKPATPVPIYIQPCDEQDEAANRDNIKVAVDICLRHGFRLCLQMHKYAEVE